MAAVPCFTTIARSPAAPAEVFRTIITLANWPTFTGFGPLPGIVEASLPPGEAMRLGARVRVRNTDGSVHHEVVTAWEPGARYAVRMELSPPASWLMRGIDEDIRLDPDEGGTRVTRRFTTHARGWWTWPVAWLVTHLLLKRAVRRHDRAVVRSHAGAAGRPPGHA